LASGLVQRGGELRPTFQGIGTLGEDAGKLKAF
jgi:hypothetical protein